MCLLLTLFMMLVIAVVTAILAVLITGTIGIITFADVIVAAIIIGMIIKHFTNKYKD